MTISVRDFRIKRGSGAASTGNVHVKVADYLRDDQGRAYAVRGINLKDGSDIVIRLADAERFAKLYLNPNHDLASRVRQAEAQIAGRTSISQIGAGEGGHAIPIDGVISIANVRADLDDGALYGRWSDAIVSDPAREVAVPATFEVRTGHVKSAGSDVRTAFIQAYFPKQALTGSAIDHAALDRMLSGRLLDTGAELRTNIAVVIKLGDETGTYAFRPKMTTDETGRLTTTRNTEAALSGSLTRLNEAVAGTAIAAKAGIPFDRLQIALPDQFDEKTQALRDLYEGVSDGSTEVTFIPGAMMQPSRLMADALLGRLQEEKARLSPAHPPQHELADRGFVSGMLGIRHLPPESGASASVVVSAIFADGKLLRPDSDLYVRRDLASVGYDAFIDTQSPSAADMPRLGHMEPANAITEQQPGPGHSADSDYSAIAPEF